jgi:hypothetical protein
MEEINYKTYQKIGDFLLGKCRQFFVLFPLVFILIILIINFRINVLPDVLYWTLSSIIQSLLALTALMIVGSIFKLQILHNQEERIADEIRLNSKFSDDTGRLNQLLSLHEIIEEINRILNMIQNKNKESSELRRLKQIKQVGEDILLSRELTKNFTLKFAIYNSFVVGLSLIFLMFTPLISNYYFGVPILYLSGLFFLYSLFLVIKGITDSLWQ